MKDTTNHGRVSPALLVFIASGVLLVGFLALLMRKSTTSPVAGHGPLTVFCAAGLKGPVEAVAREYERLYGVPVQLQFGGSQTLLASIEVAKRGDLFLPADDSYLTLARGKNLTAESIPIAHLTPVLAVRKGNPKGIRSLADCLKDGVTLAQANPDAAAVGKVTREVLQKAGLWDEFTRRTAVFKPTVNDVANDLKLGTVDAGFIWDALLPLYPEAEPVPVAELTNASALVSVALLQSCAQPAAALKFARFLGAQDKGLQEWRRQGFQTVRGDLWSERPEVNLFSGAMLRPAIEATITAFEQREGVSVTRVYNGCGILVAEMQAGKHPDAYFSCDKSLMAQVSDLFVDCEDVSQNQLVILTPKGNPRAIKSLKDLGQPGLRVGVGHEKQCALGVLTRNTLLTNGTYGAVMRNVTVQSPTGDFLVNQLLTGSLDAVVAYISNATSAKDKLEATPIDVPCAIALQPLAPARDAKYPQLTARLVSALKSAESKQRFEQAGFGWKWKPAAR